MNEAHDELTPLTAVQLLDAAIWREIDSDEPQPQEAFIEAFFRVLARWMLTRSQAPEMETLTTLCKTQRLRFEPRKNLMNEVFPTLACVLATSACRVSLSPIIRDDCGAS